MTEEGSVPSQLPSRSPEARSAQYRRNRKKPRKCRCGADIELGSRKRMCDPCRETPDPRCKKCKKVKPLSRFSRDATRPSGYFPWCMDCQLAGTKAAGFQNPEDPLTGAVCPMDDVPIRGRANRKYCRNGCKERALALKSKYGLSPAQYRLMVDAADGRCPICLRKPTGWHVDHDHTTGAVTGVVCAACNVGPLAYSLHDPDLVRRLLDYLISPPARGVGVEAYAPEGAHRSSQLHKKWSFSQRS